MRTETTRPSLLDTASQSNFAQAAPSDAPAELSPPLVLAAALVYMMAANGAIDESESSQLQSVIGKNKQLLNCAVDYVHAVPFDQFLRQAPQGMSSADKLSVLTNVCDSMLSDGYADEQELDLLHAITSAFGFSDESFEPFYQTVALKNNKSILGPYKVHDMDEGRISPHLALAACLIYMMASDGSLGPEEIGRLQSLIGEFEGLQKVAVKHALKVKSDKFLTLAAQALAPQARLFVLANVADIMLSDGVVEPAEKKLFASMLEAFDTTQEAFKPHYLAITVKNIRSFSTDDFEYVRSGPALDANGDTTAMGQLGSTINQTMRDNIVKVSQGFGSSKKIDRLARNSVQQPGADKDPSTGSNANASPRPNAFGNSDTGYAANTGRKLVAFKRSGPSDLAPPSATFGARPRPQGSCAAQDDHDTLTVQPGDATSHFSVSSKPVRRNAPHKPLATHGAAEREHAKVRLKVIVDTTKQIRVEIDDIDARKGEVSPVQYAKSAPSVAKPETVMAQPAFVAAPPEPVAAIAVSVVQTAAGFAAQPRPASVQTAETAPMVQSAPQKPVDRARVIRHPAASTLLGGLAIAAAASIFAGMAAAAMPPAAAPLSLRSSSLEPCWLASALSKQSTRPRGGVGCWQSPQPRSTLERTVLRNLLPQ